MLRFYKNFLQVSNRFYFFVWKIFLHNFSVLRESAGLSIRRFLADYDERMWVISKKMEWIFSRFFSLRSVFKVNFRWRQMMRRILCHGSENKWYLQRDLRYLLIKNLCWFVKLCSITLCRFVATQKVWLLVFITTLIR